MDRTILHCDMNAFFASVEELYDPRLRSGPMAVCGDPAGRHGIILAKNEQAKACGIVTAETVWQALKKCPSLMLVRPHHDRYRRYSAMVSEIYKRFTDLIEPFSIDESWLDVTGSIALFGDGRTIADEIRKIVREEIGLTLSAGVSFNKVFAKMGSDYKKPDATTVITRGNFRELLWPLPAARLFFVGRSTADRLEQIGIATIGQLAAADKTLLVAMFGKHGALIHDYANGLDDSPVSSGGDGAQARSVGNGITFRRDLTGTAELRRACIALSDTVAGRLRKYRLKCGGVKVDIKDPYFKTISRQKQLARPCNTAAEISRAAMEIIGAAWDPSSPVRMLTVTAISLADENEEEQLTISAIGDDSPEKAERIERALDSIRNKYGSGSIKFGGMLDDDLGIAPGGYNDEEDIIIQDEGGTE